MILNNIFKHTIALLFILNEFEFIDNLIKSFLLNEKYNILEKFLQIINVFIKKKTKTKKLYWRRWKTRTQQTYQKVKFQKKKRFIRRANEKVL